MSDDLAGTILNPCATQEQIIRMVREYVAGRNTYHGPLYVRQISPDVRDHDAVLRFDGRHAVAVAEILSGIGEKARLLFWPRHEPESFVRVHTDCRYHPYQDYFRCIDMLATYLADVNFLLCIQLEDDDGHLSYLVDRYDITDGQLRWQRSQTPDDGDLDAYLRPIR